MLKTRRIDPIYRGESWQEEFQVTDDNGEPLNMIGSDIWIEIAPSYCDNAYRTGRVDSGITLMPPNIISWHFGPEQMPRQSGVYRVKLWASREDAKLVLAAFRLPII